MSDEENPLALNALDAIMRFESGGQNVHQNVVPAGGGYNPSVGRVTGPSSASGYFQMINSTWRNAANLAGIDISQYPTAMSAPYDVQRKAANALFESEGFSNWAPYNANLRKYIAKQGGESVFASDNQVKPSGLELGTGTAQELAMKYGQHAPQAPADTVAPQVQAQATLGASPQASQLLRLAMLQAMVNNVKLQPVDYNPWAVMPHFNAY